MDITQNQYVGYITIEYSEEEKLILTKAKNLIKEAAHKIFENSKEDTSEEMDMCIRLSGISDDLDSLINEGTPFN